MVFQPLLPVWLEGQKYAKVRKQVPDVIFDRRMIPVKSHFSQSACANANSERATCVFSPEINPGQIALLDEMPKREQNSALVCCDRDAYNYAEVHKGVETHAESRQKCAKKVLGLIAVAVDI